MARLLALVWLISGAVILILSLLRPENKLFLVGVLVAAMMIFIPIVKERLRRRREGFHVTTRGNAEGGDVTYSEERKSITFYFDRTARTVYVPSSKKWEQEMPEWARIRRTQIMERIQARLGQNWKFVDKAD